MERVRTFKKFISSLKEVGSDNNWCRLKILGELPEEEGMRFTNTPLSSSITKPLFQRYSNFVLLNNPY
jgi:hypothetical protein